MRSLKRSPNTRTSCNSWKSAPQTNSSSKMIRQNLKKRKSLVNKTSSCRSKPKQWIIWSRPKRCYWSSRTREWSRKSNLRMNTKDIKLCVLNCSTLRSKGKRISNAKSKEFSSSMFNFWMILRRMLRQKPRKIFPKSNVIFRLKINVSKTKLLCKMRRKRTLKLKFSRSNKKTRFTLWSCKIKDWRLKNIQNDSSKNRKK